LRFLGYKYADSLGIDGAGGGLAKIAKPIISSLRFYDKQEHNMAAFFCLQRFLNNWGGERLTKYSEERIAYDHLFLHLYRVPPPPEFTHEEYNLRWHNEFEPDIETVAAFVRSSFRRKGRGKKISV